jgi:hypothetical protein
MPPAAIARSAIVPLLAGQSLRTEQVTQLVLGETAAILEREGDWRRLRTADDGYEGWANIGYLRETENDEAERWRAEARAWSLGGALELDGQRVRLPLRARVVLESGMVRLPDGRHGPLVDGVVTSAADLASSAKAMSPERWAALHFAGTPYEWGGVTAWGVDCSGMVQTTFAARGIALPRDASQQVACGAEVPLGSPPRAGDLLFFRGETSTSITHVAFAREGEGLVHSALACGGVVAESWEPGTRAAPLRQRLVAIRRMEPR